MIAKCPEGHEGKLVAFYFDCWIECDTGRDYNSCWKGRQYQDQESAIAAWNERMGDGWVECSERMPENGEEVLWQNNDGLIVVGSLDGPSTVLSQHKPYRVWASDWMARWHPMPKGKCK